jgi:hypothetical protein
MKAETGNAQEDEDGARPGTQRPAGEHETDDMGRTGTSALDAELRGEPGGR